MTLELAILMSLVGAVGVASFVAALWGALESTSTLSHLRERGASPEKIRLAKLMAFRSNARAFLILVLSAIAIVRLASQNLLVTPSSYAMYTLLLIAQIIVGLFVILDVYERTSVFPEDEDEDEN